MKKTMSDTFHNFKSLLGPEKPNGDVHQFDLIRLRQPEPTSFLRFESVCWNCLRPTKKRCKCGGLPYLRIVE